MRVVAELQVFSARQTAGLLDPHLVRAVDHDFADLGVRKQLGSQCRLDVARRKGGPLQRRQRAAQLGEPARQHAGRRELADHIAGLVDTLLLVHKHVLDQQLAAAHALNFADGSDFALAAGQAADLHHDIDRAGELLADRRQRQLGGTLGPHDHRFQPPEGINGGIGMHGGHRAFVAGVHRLQHVQRLGAADLAHDDAVGPHA